MIHPRPDLLIGQGVAIATKMSLTDFSFVPLVVFFFNRVDLLLRLKDAVKGLT